MVDLRLIRSLPSAPALLDAARLVPRQPDVVRARAIVRARAAVATGAVFAAGPAIRSQGLRVSLAMITCAAFAVGAAGAAAALRVRQQSPVAPTWTAAPTPSPPPALAETGAAPSAPPATSVEPYPSARRKRPLRSAAATAIANRRSYAAELECLQRARVAFAGRDFTGALAASAEHARRFPGSWLAEEREALRVRSLDGADRPDEARRAAAAFGERFPRSALLSRLRDTPAAD